MNLRFPFGRAFVVRRLAIAGLAGIAAYVHLTLGGTIFTLNAIGYGALGTAAVLLPRHGLLARLALVAFAVTTITLWAIAGARFDLAYETKAVEVALVAVVLVDVRAELLGLRHARPGAASSPSGRGRRRAESL